MILSFIQDAEYIPGHGNPEQGNSQQVPEPEQKIQSDTEPERIDYSYDNSFESKYVHFKEKIEKDRLAWETLANKK